MIAYFLKVKLKVVFCRGFIFGAVRSFAIQIIGTCDSVNNWLQDTKIIFTLVFLISPFSAPTPPLSPADIPSTSSMIRTVRPVISIPATFVF